MFNLPPGLQRRPDMAGNCSPSQFIVCTSYFSSCFLYFLLPEILGSQAQPLHQNTMYSLYLIGMPNKLSKNSLSPGLTFVERCEFFYANTLVHWQTQSWSLYTRETESSDCIFKYSSTTELYLPLGYWKVFFSISLLFFCEQASGKHYEHIGTRDVWLMHQWEVCNPTQGLGNHIKLPELLHSYRWIKWEVCSYSCFVIWSSYVYAFPYVRCFLNTLWCREKWILTILRALEQSTRGEYYVGTFSP